MKFFLLTENLQKKLPFVNKGVSSKNQLPILSNLLLKAKNGKLQILSTDLEIGIQIEIPANIEEEGSTTVLAKTFTEFINSLPSGKINIETKGDSLKVSTDKINGVFQTIPEDEFPKLYEEKGEKILTLKKEIIQKDFSIVIFAASQDGGRPALSGVYLKQDKDNFSLVATDGYRLSLKKINNPMLKKINTEERSLLIPARTFREMISIKEQEEDVDVYVSEKNNQVLFEQDGTILVGRLIEAEYPTYQKIIPSNYTTSAIFDREEMQKAVKICSIFARETANIVRISFKNGKILVSANAAAVGDNSVEVDGKLEGEENDIAFNARYLLDILSNIPNEDMVFEMTGPLNPGVFKIKNDPSYLHIIMPIRVQSEE